MNASNSSEDEPMSDLNMVPLIDIALTLVIILMVTSIFSKSGLGLNLPKTQSRNAPMETAKDMTIMVQKTGDISVDGEKMTKEILLQKLKDLAKKDKDSRVLIKGDSEVSYDRIMQVMDTAQQAGLSKVTLPTDPVTKDDKGGKSS